jgi:transcriptional regulator with XRE-family HTH domain
MSLGSRIASMRGYRQLTQGELGELVGVSKQTISGWEHDTSKPNADYIRDLCRALGCTADYLLELADDPRGHIKW